MEESGNPEEMNPGIYWIVGWVRRKGDIDATTKEKISCPCQESSTGFGKQYKGYSKETRSQRG
jgi:hypothetical protein